MRKWFRISLAALTIMLAAALTVGGSSEPARATNTLVCNKPSDADIHAVITGTNVFKTVRYVMPNGETYDRIVDAPYASQADMFAATVATEVLVCRVSAF